ncbi:hypothetical protein B0H63DRAFT_474190 [Podospora didyma]|uniref:F-box domain-containing protein n=1 Tax=Podospora didyma TaxID=330526 RepID=A0AAE0NR15_9PEZI|nr:hypothetical protein B0H63DRAFT_474190 [Podospora didyma]
METLPAELIFELAKNLEATSDLAALAGVSKKLYFFLNNELYKRNVASGGSTALFWGAETGCLNTVSHAYEAGARLDEPWFSRKIRAEFPSGKPCQVYRRLPAAQAVPQEESTRPTTFLDFFASTHAINNREYWWHALDLAAYHGHAKIVDFILDNLPTDRKTSKQCMRSSSSRGLCRICPIQRGGNNFLHIPEALTTSVATPVVLSSVHARGSGIHYPTGLAFCGGHEKLALSMAKIMTNAATRRRQIDASKPGDEEEEGASATDEQEKEVAPPAAPAAAPQQSFSYRDFVLEL